MLSDLEMELLNSLSHSQLEKFLNGGTIKIKQGWNRSDQEWRDFLDAARAHIRWERIQSINTADDVYYFTLDNSDAKVKAKEIAMEQSKVQMKTSKGSSGFDFLFMELEEFVTDPVKLKELKGLILESRPSKSKWASDDKLGQEPLYEAFEKVLTELRNYTEHSIPFLKPVQKREAPNYFDVIKYPMDLGTMGKKLKNLEYKSKEEFWKDLNLIWNNCLTYNTLPDSIYRKHANSMQQKADELMNLVPEISVKTGLEDSDDDDGKMNFYKGKVSKVMTAGSTSVNGDANHDQSNTRRPLTFAALEEVQEAMDIDNDTAEQIDTPQLDGQKDDENNNSDHVDDEDDDQISNDTFWESVQFQKWKELSLEQRAHIYKRHYIDSGLRFENKKAFVRTPEGMFDFLCQETEHLNRMKLLEEDSSANPASSEYWEKAFLPELMSPASIMPHIRQPYLESKSLDISLSKVSSANFDKSSNIYKKVFQNISELNDVIQLYYTIEGEALPSPINSPKISDDQFVSTKIDLGRNEASHILNKSIGLLLKHAGFDAIFESALCTFSDLVTGYLTNFGKNIKLCLDNAVSGISTEDILEFAFSKNGITDFQVLHSYIIGIVSQGKRLSNIKNYLSDTKNRILLQQTKSNTISEEEENELIMSGNYLSVLGIDIFNVKESGIDISEVPLELWNEKSNKQVSHVDDRLASPLKGPRIDQMSTPWKPIDGEKQIGLLKAFYARPASELIEDDQKPNAKTLKSKLMVRAAMVRKRIVIGTEAIPKKKKKTAATNKSD